ncbi:MAG: hypothetical protein KF901_23195 [Myxococcales bacterium]|nr:hypothetical protein [Myxococcales bacterium]
MNKQRFTLLSCIALAISCVSFGAVVTGERGTGGAPVVAALASNEGLGDLTIFSNNRSQYRVLDKNFVWMGSHGNLPDAPVRSLGTGPGRQMLVIGNNRQTWSMRFFPNGNLQSSTLLSSIPTISLNGTQHFLIDIAGSSDNNRYFVVAATNGASVVARRGTAPITRGIPNDPYVGGGSETTSLANANHGIRVAFDELANRVWTAEARYSSSFDLSFIRYCRFTPDLVTESCFDMDTTPGPSSPLFPMDFEAHNNVQVVLRGHPLGGAGHLLLRTDNAGYSSVPVDNIPASQAGIMSFAQLDQDAQCAAGRPAGFLWRTLARQWFTTGDMLERRVVCQNN